MKLTISGNKKILSGEVLLTGSKSESNRALIIQSLCQEPLLLHNLSEAQDTVTLQKILQEKPVVANVGPAGTAMRFLAARLCLEPGEFVLTGSERMKQRPIGILVDALKTLGANIEYLEKDGFPPLKITGGTIKGRYTKMDGSVSSQFISALCLIAPVLNNGLELEFIGEIASKPYLDMTLDMMRYFGAEHQWNGQKLTIPHQTYQTESFTVEPDWSAASYWYALAALSEQTEIKLPHLKKDSLQGDSVVAAIFEKLGVSTRYQADGIVIKKKENYSPPAFVEIDCEKYPDLAQTFATTLAGLGIPGRLSGLKSLRIKETDRITALITELAKVGITATEKEGFVLEIAAGKLHAPTETIHTYEDHRMAMAFAPLVLKVDTLSFDDASVVGKSYPGFWEHLKTLGVI